MKNTAKVPLGPWKLFAVLKQQMLQGVQPAAEGQSNEDSIKRTLVVHTYLILTDRKSKRGFITCIEIFRGFCQETYRKWLFYREGRSRLD